jgi:hypothetical protein
MQTFIEINEILRHVYLKNIFVAIYAANKPGADSAQRRGEY